jgi:hypothetical protein
LTQSFRPHYGPEVDSASNGNEYQYTFSLWPKHPWNVSRPILRWHSSRKLNVSEHTSLNTLQITFNKASQYGELLCKFRFSLHSIKWQNLVSNKMDSMLKERSRYNDKSLDTDFEWLRKPRIKTTFSMIVI